MHDDLEGRWPRPIRSKPVSRTIGSERGTFPQRVGEAKMPSIMNKPSRCMSCCNQLPVVTECKVCGDLGHSPLCDLDGVAYEGYTPVGLIADMYGGCEIKVPSDVPVVEVSWVAADLWIQSVLGVRDAVQAGLLSPEGEYAVAEWFVNDIADSVLLRQSPLAEKFANVRNEDVAKLDSERSVPKEV